MRRIAFALTGALLSLLLSPISATGDTLRGRVTDVDNLPIAGAEVLIFHGFKVKATLTSTDAGRFGPVALDAGVYEVLAVMRGYSAQPVTVTIGSGTADLEQRLILTPSPASDYVVVTAPPVGAEVLAGLTQSLTVFDRSDIVSLQATSLADLLRLAPGLQMQSRGGAGASTLVSGWGGGPGDVLILVDGVPLRLFGGSIDAAHISAADIERVEVQRGVGSLVEGAQSPSAVVRVTTMSAPSSQLDVTAEGGLEPSGHVSAAIGRNGEAWKWRAATEWLGTRGERGRPTTSGTPLSNDDYTRVTASASVMWQDRPGRFVRWQGRVLDTRRGYPGPWGSDPLGLAPGVDTTSRGLGRAESTGVSFLAPTKSFFTHRMELSIARWRGNVTSPVFAQDINTRRLRFHYHIDAEATRSTLITVGAEREWESASDSLVRNAANTPVTLGRAFGTWFMEVKQSLGTRVYLTASGRYDMATRDALEGNTSTAAFRPALAQEMRYELNARGAASAILFRNDLGDSFAIRASGGSALTPATAEEIGFSENPGLRPARSRMASAGIDLTLGHGRVTFTVDAFHYLFDDLIVPVTVQRAGIRRIVIDNVARARADGVTATTELRLPAHLFARANMTWLDTRVLDAQCACASPLPLLPIGDNSALVRRPTLAGSGSLVWSYAGHSAFLTAGGRGVMRDVEPSLGQQLFDNPGYLSVGAGASITLGPAVQAFARVTNLFDRRYEELLGYPAPRRAFVVGLRLTGRP
jgi:vitamin B12 transporter